MSNVTLSIEKLSKQYRLGEIGTGTLSHDLNRLWAKLRGKEDPYSLVGQVNDRSIQSKSEYVWALKDIDFKVQKGEVLGIIGKNGAGKSTLLKLISRVTAPTQGSIKAKGRIASLLEVGTGMHPEMTARENIYLNGAILGMKRNEITEKFDEIVEFAGCAMYIDTPVKRYSSGMRVRLGFAVAAFLEPEILIVDEVLAVGDAEFQKKAIGKMKEVSRGGGRTVLFVSHNMGSIRTLCTRAIVLDQGMQVFDGTPDESINYYLTSNKVDMTQHLADRTDRGGNGKLVFTEVKMLNNLGGLTQEIISGDKAQFVISYKTNGPILSNRFLLGVTFWDKNENRVLGYSSDEMGMEFNEFNSTGEFILDIPSLAIRGGLYDIKLVATEGGTQAEHMLDNISNAFTLTILPGDFWSVGQPNRSNNMVLLDGMIHHV
ncbi:MAG: Teichoic acid export ATP-binding protein TagH (EC [uncultured Aureispira sp.]|uniref:Teichoic acid export ATP-binding protein TagH (EC) n=1 Tax=uncultured Aureispira sp. TaxID=1331704 RepID=A0A6S6UEA0_9BACT|nr:MAG: Teichoic acid export ATP-binding protein TagH (EC [uncultured Aureispira sp.]